MARTWADVQAAVKNCPVLYRMVTLERQGLLTREQALIDAVLVLSNAREMLLAENANLLKGWPQVPGQAGTVPVRVFESKVDHLVHSSAVAVASAGGWTVEQAEFGLKRLLNSRIRLDQAVRLMVAYGLLRVDADAATRQKMLEDLTNPDHQ